MVMVSYSSRQTEEKVKTEARQWFRHEVGGRVFFMLTCEERPLAISQHNLEGNLVNVSENGFRLQSPMPLEQHEQISFEIVSGTQTVFSGVAQVVHCNNQQEYGVRYIKVRKH